MSCRYCCGGDEDHERHCPSPRKTLWLNPQGARSWLSDSFWTCHESALKDAGWQNTGKRDRLWVNEDKLPSLLDQYEPNPVEWLLGWPGIFDDPQGSCPREQRLEVVGEECWSNKLQRHEGYRFRVTLTDIRWREPFYRRAFSGIGKTLYEAAHMAMVNVGKRHPSEFP